MNVNSSRVGIASASQDTCKNIIFHLGLWGKEQTKNGREKEGRLSVGPYVCVITTKSLSRSLLQVSTVHKAILVCPGGKNRDLTCLIGSGLAGLPA